MEIEALEKEFKDYQKTLERDGGSHPSTPDSMQDEDGTVRWGPRRRNRGENLLSRPDVSQHLGILKEAGIVKIRKEGTKNFYCFDADASAVNGLIEMLSHVQTIMEARPIRTRKKNYGIHGCRLCPPCGASIRKQTP